jgi:hypothetical protein
MLAYGGAALLAGLATVTFGLRWLATGDSAAGSPVSGPAVRVFATLPTREVFFGDQVRARVELLVDRARVRIPPVVHARFAPYSIVGRETTSETLGTGYERRVTTFSLRCLQQDCVPPAAAHRVFRFPAVRVTAAGQPELGAAWPPLVVVSRLYGSSGLRAGALREPEAVAGTPDHWSSPLLWSSGGLALTGVALLGGWGWRRREGLRPDPVSAALDVSIDPVAEACARVQRRLPGENWARQRASLDLLARTLVAAGSPRLADEARELAWRRERPSDDEIEALLEHVRHHYELEDGARVEAA